MTITVRDILPLIKYNDVRLVRGEDEICLIRKDYNNELFSEKYLNMAVAYIENEEEILDTINIHIKK